MYGRFGSGLLTIIRGIFGSLVQELHTNFTHYFSRFTMDAVNCMVCRLRDTERVGTVSSLENQLVQYKQDPENVYKVAMRENDKNSFVN